MGARDDLPELLSLVDRLEQLRERSSLAELEIGFGETTLILRSQAAVTPIVAAVPAPTEVEVALEPLPAAVDGPEKQGAHAVLAPLTGVFYSSPSPGAEPYLREGGQVNTGQVIGLIEAMKLFNEIKSDVTGTVRNLVAGDGELVKAKETLIEVDPS